MLIKIPALIAQVQQHVNCISAVDAATMRPQVDGILIDVREPGEYAAKASPGAINIPRGVLEMKVLEQYPEPDKAIFIYCAGGARAVLAAEQLIRLGYKQVWAITCKVEQVIQAHQNVA
ncbi:rhodanese-like domain-containing protein [Thalassotalea aquiviva]|uniref:rhodanese-like domain-containing protein n=1 Tax=Thalassotalea aquiviva TaxID=3242415 RepID=UPI00352BB94A